MCQLAQQISSSGDFARGIEHNRPLHKNALAATNLFDPRRMKRRHTLASPSNRHPAVRKAEIHPRETCAQRLAALAGVRLMELWIILPFIGALALIGFLFWDAKRRFDKRVRSLLRMQQTLRESDATNSAERRRSTSGRSPDPSAEPSD